MLCEGGGGGKVVVFHVAYMFSLDKAKAEIEQKSVIHERNEDVQ